MTGQRSRGRTFGFPDMGTKRGRRVYNHHVMKGEGPGHGGAEERT